jgi:hypothetical protein
LTEGLALAREVGMVYAEGRFLRVAADLHARGGDTSCAREALHAATEIFERLGARRDLAAVCEQLGGFEASG